jgi:hypothetical protein
MTTILGDSFEWTRVRSKAGENAYEHSAGRIVQIGRGKQRYQPLKISGLYLKFAELDGSPAACVAFASRWGLLSLPTTTPPSETLDFWKKEIRRMTGLIRMLPDVVKVANSRSTIALIGSLDVFLVPGPDDRPALALKPNTLLQAMNLQLAQWVSSSGLVLQCQHCGRAFQAGVGTERRPISRYCSTSCKNAHYYQQTKQRAGK